MKTAVILLGLVVLFLLAGVIPHLWGEADPRSVFASPVFVLLLAAVCVWMGVAACRRRSLWFVLAHVGCIVLVAGALWGRVAGVRAHVNVPLTERHVLTSIRDRRTHEHDLGFGVSATNFRVAYYPPQYDLMQGDATLPIGAEGALVAVGRFEMPERGEVDLGEAGTLNVRLLRRGTGGIWLRRYRISDGWHLMLRPRTPRTFETTLCFRRGEQELARKTVRVNRPARFEGWILHLNSFDPHGNRFVELLIRRDPGRPFVLTGIWMVMVGVAGMCWRLPSFRGSGRGRHDDA